VKRGYSYEYQQARKVLLEGGPMCVYCRVKVADTADHVPPLSSAPCPELWHGELVPACKSCNSHLGAKIVNDRRRKIKSTRQW
jgi:5-methylcytosine-specific restriction endonuclease McrA